MPVSELPTYVLDPDREWWAVTWTHWHCCTSLGMPTTWMPVRLFWTPSRERGPDGWHTADAVWLRAALPMDRLVKVLAREMVRAALDIVLRDHGIEHPSERLTSRLELEVAEIVGKVADAWERQQEAERADIRRRTRRRKWATALDRSEWPFL